MTRSLTFISAAAMVAIATSPARADQTTAALTYKNPLPVVSSKAPLPPGWKERHDKHENDYLADPDLSFFEGRYYLYTTSADSATHFFDPNAARGIRCFSSADLRTWQDEGVALNARDAQRVKFGRQMFWQPQLVHNGEYYYLFYNACGEEYQSRRIRNWGESTSPFQRLCVSRSKSPSGPFEEWRAPLLEGTEIPGFVDGKRGVIGCIDVFAFEDAHAEDANTSQPAHWYLYWSGIDDEHNRNLLWGAELKPDFSGLKLPPDGPEPRIILGEPLQPWETRACGGRKIVESPSVIRRGDTYYLAYSANSFNTIEYAMGYATAKSPLGPFTRAANNPVLRGAKPGDPEWKSPLPETSVIGPAGGGFFQISSSKHPGGDGTTTATKLANEMSSPNSDPKTYFVYASIESRTTVPLCGNGAGWLRRVCLDEAKFAQDGTIEKIKPTRSTPQPLP